MAKKQKVKKTLVEQILTKAKIEHIGLQINALEGILPEGIDRSTIFKTLALKGDKTGPVIGIIPITEHLSEKKLAKLSGNKKIAMIPQKDLEKTTGYIHGANNPVGIRQKHPFPIFIDESGNARRHLRHQRRACQPAACGCCRKIGGGLLGQQRRGHSCHR